MDNPNTINDEMMARLDRFSTSFPDYVQRLEKENKKISENIPKVTLEMEEFKKIQNNLSSFLSGKMKEVYTEQSKTFSKYLMDTLVKNANAELKEHFKEISKDFREQIQQEKVDLKRELDKHAAQATEINEKYREGADKFTKDMEGTVSTLKQLLTLQKQRLTRKGLLICGVFCLASVLSGTGIFYFFPQNIYYSDPNVARYMMMGRSTWENMKHLSVKDQNLLLDGMKKYMAKK